MPNKYRFADLTNRQFGELKVIGRSDIRNKHNARLWKCECSCKKIIHVPGYSLTNGLYWSCGCQQKKRRDEGARRHIEKDAVEGTRKTALKAKLHKNNKSGHKGVYWVEASQKWRAYIGFKGKNIHIGYYINKEDAILARQKAEEELFGPILASPDRDLCQAPGCENPTRSHAKYCSDRCRSRAHKAKLRQDRGQAGLCPQCGKPWVEPLGRKNGRTKHCRRCQEYYKGRRKQRES